MSSEISEFKFLGYKVVDIEFKLNEEYLPSDEKHKLNPTYKIDFGHSDENTNIRIIRIACSLFKNDKEKRPFSISVTINGIFDVEYVKSEEVDKIMQYNGVAIMLPYVRALISQVTALAWKQNVNLPLINVQHLYDNVEIKAINKQIKV